MTPLRVGLIGCGAVAAAHVRDFYGVDGDEVRLVACADRDDGVSRRFAAAHGVPDACDVEELVRRPDIDAVDICTPPDSHVDLIARAAEHGKHAICEKPLALDLDEAEAVVAAAARAGVKVGVMQNYRWRPEYRDVRALVAEGHLGLPQLVALQAHFDWHRGVRKARMLMLEVTYHYVDLLRFLLRRDVVRAYAAAGSDDAYAALVLELESGAVGSITNATGCRGIATNWGGTAIIQGSDGAAYVNHPQPFRMAACAPVLGGRIERTYPRDLYPLSTGSRFGEPLAEFFRAVAADREPPVSAAANLNTLAAVLACCESAETGRAVEVR